MAGYMKFWRKENFRSAVGHARFWLFLLWSVSISLLSFSPATISGDWQPQVQAGEPVGEASPCPGGIQCESIDCVGRHGYRPRQEPSMKGLCKIGIGRLLVLRAPKGMVFFGKSAVGLDSVCEVVSPITWKNRKRFKDEGNPSVTGVDSVAVRGKGLGQTSVTLWFKRVSDGEAAKELFPVTYDIEVVVPKDHYAVLQENINLKLCGGECKATCRDQCVPSFHFGCVEDCRDLSYGLTSLDICEMICEEHRKLLCSNCETQQCQDACHPQKAESDRTDAEKMECEKCRESKCKYQCVTEAYIKKEHKKKCDAEYLACGVKECPSVCSPNEVPSAECKTCTAEKCCYRCGSLDAVACRRQCEDRCLKCKEKQCQKACIKCIENPTKACKKCREKKDRCVRNIRDLENAEQELADCQLRYCVAPCETLADAIKRCRECVEGKCPNKCAKDVPPTEECKECLQENKCPCKQVMDFSLASVQMDCDECGKRKCPRECSAGKSKSDACKKCRAEKCPTDCGAVPVALQQSCRDCKELHCHKEIDELASAKANLENCGQELCYDDCVKELVPALEKCNACKEQKCRQDCVRRGKQTEACKECQKTTFVQLLPLPTGKGLIVSGMVEKETQRDLIFLLLKKSGIPEENLIHDVVIAPRKKSAPSDCQRAGGGC